MNILIIGAKGFIGSHLLDYFKEKNHQVWGADVVVDYTLRSNYFLIDASNSDFTSLLANNQYDVCINCSGAASVPQSIDQPFRDFLLNTANVFKILEAIRLNNTECKFINFSSAAIYGNPDSLPIKESQKKDPMSPYGQHKWMSEQICQEFSNYFKLKTCSLRVFSAFGEGLHKQIFWDIAQKAAHNDIIELYGTGNESRDLAFAVECIINKADFNGEAVNIANGEEISIYTAVAEFLDNFESPKIISFGGQVREGDPLNWVADISLLKSFGYVSKFSFSDGLKYYYDWLLESGHLKT
jgi:dTDP-glucose 4,6-dehydratase/UDP-glucose 4-epimerase